MLIDMHSHTSGISRCSKINYKDLIDLNKSFGIDGIILCNHYEKGYVVDGDVDAFANKYIKEYYDMARYGKEVGYKVFFGIEVTLAKYNNAHLLIYGVEPEFLLSFPDIFDYDLEYIREIVKDRDAYLIQAHMLRVNNPKLDPRLLDGIEFNCHFKKNGPQVEEIIRIAKEENFIITCGGDFHNDTPRNKCGIICPDNITDTLDLLNYINRNRTNTYLIHETPSDEPYEIKVTI